MGTVEYALRFNEHASSLVFDVISAHNLVPHSADGKISPYVSVRLYLDSPTGQMLKVKRHTNIIDNTLSPIFDNRFEFDVKQDELTNYRFVLIVKDHQHRLLSKPTNLGQVHLSHSLHDLYLLCLDRNFTRQLFEIRHYPPTRQP